MRTPEYENQGDIGEDEGVNYERAMEIALEQAHFSSKASGDVPVGAVVLDEVGRLVGIGSNRRELLSDPVGHAEIVAIKSAARALGKWRLDGCTLVVTLEPCAMCAGAIQQSRISRVVFGAFDEKAGAVGSSIDILRDPRALQKVEVVSGLMKEECARLLGDFFKERRA
jgi:tRNA(adenine34) deaminase